MKKIVACFACSLFVFVGLWPSAAYPHSPYITFRAYLDKRFWQPFSKFEKSLDMVVTQKQQKADAGKQSAVKKHVYAGMSADPGNEVIINVRKSYRSAEFPLARAAVETARNVPLAGSEREELSLVDAKLDIREGGKEPLNRELLLSAISKLKAFLNTSQIPSWKSEARGWLARAHYLLGDYSPAAKIYLDDLSSGDSIYSRESLISSLLMLFPYNGSSARLSDHLEEYFDTPGHALFVVNIVTNPIYNYDAERAAMGAVAQKVLAALHNHEDLFRSGVLSDQLALALMRAAMYRGDTRNALSYARRIPGTSDIVQTPEYNWMIAACHFLQREYMAVEAPLLKILGSGQASRRDKNAAAQGLIGAYQKTGKRTDQLRAAFLYFRGEDKAIPIDYFPEDNIVFSSASYIGFTYWPMGGWLFDLPYLLDVQLTDEELSSYIDRYAKESRHIKIEILGRQRTAYEMVKYALAVRHARREKYRQAFAIYEQLGARPRAKRMKELIKLHADATDTAFSKEKHLEAQYAYAAFLEGHSTGIFFNDMLWHGYQTWSFVKSSFDDSGNEDNPKGDQGFTREEREFFLKQERALRDDQEERWRAYNILNGVVEQAGKTELGRRAALKALRCLDLIHTGRFGREAEINAAKQKLIKWLKDSGKERKPQKNGKKAT